ncbi:unnamed protein product [Pieris macdunnoughi]|uniref:NEDD8 ultimate buster 1 n=1 Tax=Pieris macdunnoughi TaxID=345717 RepID=A0A821M934_9NEOP|nr:unnamed protein product [Pieris macdunnoughi]
MQSSLEHEDLLIKLRAKLNEGKIKLWEPPYVSTEGDTSHNFQELANRIASELSLDMTIVLDGLLELQQHSVDRSKANEEFKETGCATLRVKAPGRGEKGVFKVMKKLNVMGTELINTICEVLGVENTRLKLIFNGKVINPSRSLEDQGVKNGIQLMALIMAENTEALKREDDMYLQMKQTLEDATLLSECYDDLGDESYLNLEDQTGKTVDLPKSERRSLFIGLALHERGRTCVKKREYAFALVLLLEADRQLSECRAQILNTVDNYGVLQLDIAWCYLGLQSLQAANDAAARLAKAEVAFTNSYGPEQQRLIALKGTDANERVLFMRLYLLQGIVAYHQNNRTLAKELLDKAERELNNLRVDESSVQALMELGWSECQAYAGLRAAQGDVNGAHHYLDTATRRREVERRANRDDREQRALGLCEDGSPVDKQLTESLVGMGYSRKLAVLALRNANNNVTDAVRIIQEQPELLEDSDLSEEEESTEPVVPDNQLLSELCSMGFESETAKYALKLSRNDLVRALDILHSEGPCADQNDTNNPSTSTEANTSRKRQKKEEKRRKRKARQLAVHRLRQTIRYEDDDYLSSPLSEEEHFLIQYKSLL